MSALPSLAGYEELVELGRGGMASVFRARQRSLGRDVAIKCLREDRFEPEARRRLAEEARLLAGLGHPGIVAVHDVIESGDGLFIVMEYLRGGSLRERLASGVTPAQALRWLVQIARALDHAHRRGVVHRDLKPDNVLFRDEDNVVLTDFGIAHRPDTPESQRITAVGTVLGTPAYLSPEQIEGGRADARTDLYALGVLMHELLTGQLPFAGESARATMLAHLHRAPPPLPEALRSLQPLRDRLLAKAPDDRPHSAAAVLDLLRTALRGDPRLLSALVEGAASVSDRLQALGLDSSNLDLGTPTQTTTLRHAVPRRWSWTRRWSWMRWAALSLLPLLVGGWWLLRPPSPAPGPDAATAAAANAGTQAAARQIARTEPASLAVLPLRNLSVADTDQYFADGLTEELIGLLSRMKGLRVPSRASSFAMTAEPRSPAEIGRLLSVQHLLDGSVRRHGERARISVQLVRIEGDQVLWSQNFDRDNADLLQVQDEIARAIAAALQVELGVALPNTLLGQASVDPQAYDAYLRGLQLFHQRGSEDQEAGRAWFEQAIALEPGFARAHGALALLLAEQFNVEIGRLPLARREALLEEASAAAERALALEPDNVEALLALGRIDGHRMRWASAIDRFDRAIERDPGNALAYLWRAITFATLGRLDETERDLRAALERDPASRQALDWAARGASIRGDWQAALDYTGSALRLGLAHEVIFHVRFFALLAMLRPDDLERELAERATQIHPSTLQLYRAQLAALRELLASDPPPRDGETLVKAHFVGQGIEAALEVLRSEYRSMGLESTGWIWYPSLTELRADPRFAAITAELGMHDFWRERGWPTACIGDAAISLECGR
jgi:eukaryotic-like serine/threonine-protein kinase